MLIVIPARGGSQGVRRKNLLPIGGEPAFIRSARIATEVMPSARVVVSTDDAEIAAVAQMAGYEILDRGPDLSEVGVNEVVRAVAAKLNWAGQVMLIQPTVQPLTARLLGTFLNECYGDRSVAMGSEERHQIWDADGDRITPPLQRQEDANWPTKEAGIRWWPKADLIWHADTIVTFEKIQIIDIDTWGDYVSAQQSLRAREQSTVTFMPLANQTDGRGHLYRCLALAPLFGAHRVMFLPADNTELWAIKLIHDHGWKTTVQPIKSDLVINDRLDTTAAEIFAQREWANSIVNLEDLGTGAEHADLVVNALYESGGDWAVVRPEFLVKEYDLMREPRGKVLVMMNTDPSGFLQAVVNELDPWFEVNYMVPSDVPLAVAMADADVLVTSGGRTVFEAAALGVPTVVMPQHARELEHSHLGQGKNLIATLGDVRAQVEEAMTNRRLRVVMSANGRIDGKGSQRIAAACEWLIEGNGSQYLSTT